jgi:hypothetical protein
VRKATAVACASALPCATRSGSSATETAGRRFSLIHHGINHPYRPQPAERARALLARLPGLDPNRRLFSMSAQICDEKSRRRPADFLP